MRDLSGDIAAFVQELDEIESIFATCKGAPTVSGYRFRYAPTEDGCLVAIWDAWNRFLRTLLVVCASDTALGLGGTLYTPAAFRTEAQVLADLNSSPNKRGFILTRGEPKWSNATAVTNVAAELGLANASVIVGAVGSSSITLGPITVANPMEEVRTCRNFIAHKNEVTLDDVLVYASEPFVDMTKHVREKRSGAEAFSEWKDCMVAIATSAAQ